MNTKTRESKIEQYLGKKAKALGFLYWKFPPTDRDGVPDRILIGYGKTVFVELKKPGETLRKKQKYRHKQILEHGGEVYIVDSIAKAEILLKTLLESTNGYSN